MCRFVENMYFSGTLNISPVQCSCNSSKKRPTTPQPAQTISPKLSNQHPNNLDGKIALQARRAFDFTVNCLFKHIWLQAFIHRASLQPRGTQCLSNLLLRPKGVDEHKMLCLSEMGSVQMRHSQLICRSKCTGSVRHQSGTGKTGRVPDAPASSPAVQVKSEYLKT